MGCEKINLSVYVSLIFSLILYLCSGSQSGAQEWKCDCSQIISSCRAYVNITENKISLQSSSSQCSWVMFDVNGSGQSSTFTGGSNVEEWLGSKIRSVSVTSCRVCKTVNASASQSPQNYSGAQFQEQRRSDDCAAATEAINTIKSLESSCLGDEDCLRKFKSEEEKYRRMCN
jgi:hypothetical protein